MVSTISRTLFDPLTCPDTFFISSGLFLLCKFAIAPTNNVSLIKSSSSVSLDATLVARFVAAAFGMVVERATLLRNKSVVCHQPNLGLSLACKFIWTESE